ncbi:cysteine desulfuration protein SufE [Larkinella arboricola]|uniref:Cysteine desulfuration protein SufE n=1 Tax=Larkinella arboricola TaxID=643671 RepID=A0A327X8I3_LARAB|nr:SufE family protein [Larkinella arboricola]RAK03235.1 cysteine desulfuration protein SufE [Larkinella arboricola]
MTINEKQDEIIEEFDLFDDQLDKTQYIIDLGKKLPPMPEQYQTDDNLIRGCQSKVWLHSEMQGTNVHFEADSEPTAQISKGLVSLLIRILSDEKPEAVASADLYFIDRIGLSSLVTSRRAGGLASMIQQMKQFATQQAAKNQTAAQSTL